MREDYLKTAFEMFKAERNMPWLVLGKTLGSGSFSTVFELEDRQRKLVVKVVASDQNITGPEKIRTYVYAERDSMLKCGDSGYTMPLMDFYEANIDETHGITYYFLVMPCLTVLTDYYNRADLTEKQLVRLAIDISKALDICEKNGILHRDVKASNIYVSEDQDGEPAFLLGDFGVSRSSVDQSEPVTRIGSFVAPEIMACRPLNGSYNSDVYSLGFTMYFLCCDDYPMNVLQKDPPAEFSAELRRIMIKATENDPRDRYAHAAEMAADLERLKHSGTKMSEDAFENLSSKAKCSILEKNFMQALDYAEKGHKRGDSSCSRLYAYLLYCSAARNPAKVNEAIAVLQDLTYEDDNTARCILSLIGLDHFGGDAHKEQNYKNLMTLSADRGCVIAEYFIGRWLFDGQYGLKPDQDKGMKYLSSAIKKNFPPALLYLKKRLENRDTRFEYSPETVRALNSELSGFDDSRTAEAIAIAI